MTTANLEFLLELDKKLHKVIESTFTPNMEGASFDATFDSYTAESLTEAEIEKTLSVVKSGEFTFYPINTAMGFSVGFSVVDSNNKSLLKFRESQLPVGYDFAKLSEYFMRSENIKRAEALGVHVQNNRGHYDY